MVPCRETTAKVTTIRGIIHDYNNPRHFVPYQLIFTKCGFVERQKGPIDGFSVLQV